MKVSELSGARLDYWVARVEGVDVYREAESGEVWHGNRTYRPSTDWEHGGQIIERNRIYLDPQFDDSTGEFTHYKCGCYCPQGTKDHFAGEWAWHIDKSPLVSAMRAYVASKFGEEVPDLEE